MSYFTENLLRSTFWKSKKPWYRILTRRRLAGVPIKTFRLNVFVREYRNLSYRPHSVFQNTSVIESIDVQKGRENYHDSSSETFSCHVTKKPSEHTSHFEKKSWFPEFSRIRAAGRLSRCSVGIVLSPSTETFRSGTFLCFRNFHKPEKFGDKRRSDYQDSAWGILSPHSTETVFRGTFLSLRKFLLTK